MKDINFKIDLIDTKTDKNLYRVNINIPMTKGWIERVRFVVKDSKEEKTFQLKHLKNHDDMVLFSGDVSLSTKAIYHYYFSFEANKKFMYFKNGNITDDKTITLDECFKMGVNFEVPDWAKGKIMYHIFVDRFNRGENKAMEPMPRRKVYSSWSDDMIIGPNDEGIWNADFYGGDLKGIEQKIDYLKSLGVSILYLSPVVHSQSNHRYDAADYENVDPYAGFNQDLENLCKIAHENGMKVVLDAVFNHTGNDSKYFNEYGTFDTKGAFNNPDSKYAKFYRYHMENGILKPDYWWGMKNLPVCDGNSKEWQEYITGKNGIIDKWFELGIDGLRLDVADELTDEYIENIRKAVKRNKKDGLIIGEVWKNPMRMNRGYIESGKGMDTVMNYPLVDALIRYFKYSDTEKLSYIIKDIKREYPDETICSLMNFTSTHDISRAINIFSSDNFKQNSEWAWDPINRDLKYCKDFKLTKEGYIKGLKLYKAYVFSLAFMPGILSIFYGDEIGLEGYGNLANRKPFPWDSIDEDLLTYFKKIGEIRNKEKFLEQADLNVYDINKDTFTFERTSDINRMFVAINRSNEEKEIKVPETYEKSEGIYVLKKSNKKLLAPYGAIAIKKY